MVKIWPRIVAIGETSATNSRLFFSTSASLIYFLMFYAFLFVVLLKITASSKKMAKLVRRGKYRVNIIMDDKTLQYFHVPIAYQIQQLIKNVGAEGCGYLSLNIQTWLENILLKRICFQHVWPYFYTHGLKCNREERTIKLRQFSV